MDSNLKILIEEIHKAFKYFNKDFFNNELIEPALSIQSKGNRTQAMGWCTSQKVWVDGKKERRHEINIAAEYLHLGFEETMNTLLHEMIHLYHLQYNIADTSRKGMYHNQNFKKIAEKIGFVVESNKRTGWSNLKYTDKLLNTLNSYDLRRNVYNFYRLSEEDVIKANINDNIKAAIENGASEDEINILLIESQSVMLELNNKKKSIRNKKIKYYCKNCKTEIFAEHEVNVLCVDCGLVFCKK